MAAVPARVADVNEVIVCSPPDASGKPSPHVLAAAEIAGVDRVFIGLENINPDNLVAAKKNQNKITDYRVMLQKWHQSGA